MLEGYEDDVNVVLVLYDGVFIVFKGVYDGVCIWSVCFGVQFVYFLVSISWIEYFFVVAFYFI